MIDRNLFAAFQSLRGKESFSKQSEIRRFQCSIEGYLKGIDYEADKTTQRSSAIAKASSQVIFQHEALYFEAQTLVAIRQN